MKVTFIESYGLEAILGSFGGLFAIISSISTTVIGYMLTRALAKELK